MRGSAMRGAAIALALCWAAVGGTTSLRGEAAPTAKEFAALFERAAKWQVGTNIGDVELARAELASAGESAFGFLFESKLGVAKTLEQRALDDVVLRRKDLAPGFVSGALPSASDPWVRINLARLARKLDLKSAAPTLATWLPSLDERGPFAARRLAQEIYPSLAALDPARLPALAGAGLAHPDPWVRVATLRALGMSGRSDAAAPVVERAQSDEAGIVRGAASLALIDLGEVGLAALIRALDGCTARDAALQRCAAPVLAAVELRERAALVKSPPAALRAMSQALARLEKAPPPNLAALLAAARERAPR